jgi:hypothetical protein
MSSTVPSRSNDYKFAPAPAKAELDRATWDRVMAGTEPGEEGIAVRLRALEAKRNELQDLIDDLSFNGQARLDQAVVPLIENMQLTLQSIADDVAATQAQNDALLADFQQVTAVNLEALADSVQTAEQQLADVQQQFALILAGGLAAAKVQESATRVFVTPAEKAEIGALREDLTGLAESVGEHPVLNGVLDGGTF